VAEAAPVVTLWEPVQAAPLAEQEVCDDARWRAGAVARLSAL
jgi:hypothetical protein